ncbi:MAG: four helix bundle protein [Saprospiraceae bacterium]|nr:four helix bundle protein [Saprospiraceae bacterium]
MVKNIFEVTQVGELSKDWDTKSQLKRAALSIMNNIAEGFGRFQVKDSMRFYDIAKSSAYEVKSMLYVLEDAGYINEGQKAYLHQLTNTTLQLTLGWIRYLSQKHPH